MKVHGADGGEEKVGSRVAPRSEKSQYEPLDLSVRPDAASPRAPRDCARQHCVGTAACFVLSQHPLWMMAPSLQANHLGKANAKITLSGVTVNCKDQAREASAVPLLPSGQSNKEMALFHHDGTSRLGFQHGPRTGQRDSGSRRAAHGPATWTPHSVASHQTSTSSSVSPGLLGSGPPAPAPTGSPTGRPTPKMTPRS